MIKRKLAAQWKWEKIRHHHLFDLYLEQVARTISRDNLRDLISYVITTWAVVHGEDPESVKSFIKEEMQ